MPSKKPTGDIDPRLLERIQAAGDKGMVQAIVMVEMPATATKTVDPRGPAGALVDRVSKQMNETPADTHYLARLGGVSLTASGSFLTKLLKSKSVVTATTPDADIYGSAL